MHHHATVHAHACKEAILKERKVSKSAILSKNNDNSFCFAIFKNISAIRVLKQNNRTRRQAKTRIMFWILITGFKIIEQSNSVRQFRSIDFILIFSIHLLASHKCKFHIDKNWFLFKARKLLEAARGLSQGGTNLNFVHILNYPSVITPVAIILLLDTLTCLRLTVVAGLEKR